MTHNSKTVIGASTYVKVFGVSQPVPAKVDTGADGTSLWVSDIRIDDDNVLYFKYFDSSSALFDGVEHSREAYKIVRVTSSTGDTQVRFKIKQKIQIGGKLIIVWCTLADRSRRTYPMLIGKRTLTGRFVVDVSVDEVGFVKPVNEVTFHERFLENPESVLGEYRSKSGGTES